MTVPEKPILEGLEAKWIDRWETDGIYRFDRSKTREQIYAIDTPPPTVSGSLHVGHVFSYTHTDIIARFQRMRGKEIFYPMGWDDNGLPTERRVQNYYGVRCDPSLPYDPDFTPPAEPARPPIPLARANFVELCARQTAEDEKAYEELWRRLGLSVDWTMTYATIDETARRAAQRSFLRLLERGLAYQKEAPTLWDVDFETAVAQAELEDREMPGTYYRIRFARSDGQGVEIDTTRPELLPACVALVAHPDDARYQPLFETDVITPLFGVRVPVKAHKLADPEKGTGIAMICTFGDVTDVTWWRELSLPVRAVIQPDGTLRPVKWGPERSECAAPTPLRGRGSADGLPPPPARGGWESTDPERAQHFYDALAGLSTKEAQARIVELLRQSGDLRGDPRPMTHPVKFFEKGDRPLEIITSRQWFIRTDEYREAFLARGRELRWYPDFMRLRYEDWVNGLNGDWPISRQRFFGVPFPLWYRINADGSIDDDHPILPRESRLPVDPSSDVPEGFRADQRGQPGGFIADPDVMDTWATSSLTPQIAGRWEDDPDLFARLFPMDLRPQAHEIIRTWLFSTVVRAHFEHNSLPWAKAVISGFVVDPDRKKMSKSKGNVVTPLGLLEEHGSDAVRYWAAGGRPGMDMAFDTAKMKVGHRLAVKILNASRFVLSQHGPEGDVTAALDRAMLGRLTELVEEVSLAFEQYDYTGALERTETFFWSFCDDTIELVKARAYGWMGEEGTASANRALTLALSTLLRLFAPFLPFVTEEVWSWWQEGSVHRSPWPRADELRAVAGNAQPQILDVASAVLSEVRKAKTLAKQSLRLEVVRVTVRDTAERLAALKEAEADLRHAGNIRELSLQEGDGFAVGVELAAAG